MGLFSRKSLESLREFSESKEMHLSRSLSTFDLIMFGIGAIIGAGLFSITGIAAAENAGPAIILAFLIAAIGCAFAALCYSELTTMIPVSGSAYTYAYAAMGELPAWVIGWSLILEYALGTATVAISWSAYLISFFEEFGITFPSHLIASPWQPVVHSGGHITYGLINLPAVFIVCLMSFLIMRGIKQSAIINTCIVAIKMSVVFLFIAFGFFYINYSNFVPFIPENTGNFGEFGWSGILRAAGVVFFAYIGFDSISTTALETKDPTKSLPRGILGSLLICTIIYIIFAFVMTGLTNYKNLNVAAPVSAALENTPFNWLERLINFSILIGMTSVILVFLISQSRIFFMMSVDGLLPKLFSTVHPVYQTPWLSNIAIMTFVCLLAAFSPLAFVGHMTSIGTLLAFTMVCGGVIVLRYLAPDYPRPFKVPFFPLVPILGMLVCFGMMVFLELETWIGLIVWMLIGLVIYFSYGRHHSTLVE